MTEAPPRLEVRRLLRADRDRVFAAWTDPKMIVQWWGAGGITCPAAEMDLAVGGSYRIANQGPDGSVMWITGTFRRVDVPSELAYTWAMEPIDDATTYSLVEVSFDEVDGGTLITICHTQIASAEARETHEQGWVGCLAGLDELLTT